MYTNAIRATVLRAEFLMPEGLGVLLQKISQCNGGAKYMTTDNNPFGIRFCSGGRVKGQPIMIAAAHRRRSEMIGCKLRAGRAECVSCGVAYGFASISEIEGIH